MNKLIVFSSFFFFALVFSSCKKDPSQAGGSNSLVYESEGDVNLLTNFSSFVNIATFHIENAKPYENIIGDIISTGKETLINGNGTEISNIEVSNIMLQDVEITCTKNLTLLNNILDDCTLQLEYFDFQTSSPISLDIATFNQVNMQSAIIEFNIPQTDLTSFMENKPDNLRLKLQFNDAPSDEIEVNYRISFRYDYTYDERERKD